MIWKSTSCLKLLMSFILLCIAWYEVTAQKAELSQFDTILLVQTKLDKNKCFRTDIKRIGLVREGVQSTSLKPTRYDFKSFDNWEYMHQDTATIEQYKLAEGNLFLSTRAQTYDRTKVNLTAIKLKTGRSSCKVYIPTMHPFDQTSIASFLYCDDRHEVDFEIGYGKADTRKEYDTEPDEVLCYMTSQAHPFQSEIVNLKMNSWYIIDLDITLKDGKYFIQWLIDGEQKAALNQNFGKEVEFRAILSLENLKFLGDHIPAHNYEVKFDWLDITHYKDE